MNENEWLYEKLFYQYANFAVQVHVHGIEIINLCANHVVFGVDKKYSANKVLGIH